MVVKTPEAGREGGAMALAKRKPKPVAEEQAELDPAELMRHYRTMLLIRRFEEKAGQMYGMGLIGGFCHLYIGEEAVVVGMHGGDRGRATPSSPPIATTATCSPAAWTRRASWPSSPGGAAAIPRARAARCTCSRARRISSAATASSAPRCRSAPASPSPTTIATTAASRLTFLGDGAINQGQVYESFNMAALWKLPVVYIIENNQYGMGTSVTRASASHDLFARGAPFGIPGHQVDGMDVSRCARRRRRRSSYAARGQGPVSSSRC